MDNTLNLKLEELGKSLQTLAEVVNRENETDQIIQDATIKRFEYTHELCWKTAKVFLSEKFGMDVFSPKECFRELRKNKLISDKETELLIKMTDDRNEVIHTYNEQFSDELYEKIGECYFELLKKVYEVLRKAV